MNKQVVLQAILDALREEFESFRASSVSTRVAGNDAESRSEGKYDTRSIEENYLADGLARQAQATAQAAAAYEKLILQPFDDKTPIDLGALVQLEFGPGDREWFFLGPAGGGIEVQVDGVNVTVITPESPLGGQLIDRKTGARLKSPAARICAVA